MATRRPLLAPVLLIVSLGTFGACGDDDDEAATPTSGTAVVTTASTVTTEATSTAATSTAAPTTLQPATTAPPTTAPTTTARPTTTTGAPTTEAPATVPDGPIQIDVMVGVDSSPERVERVMLGSPITLNVTNPAAADEFHLHDYDLGDEIVVPAGTMATFNFVADRAGSFELESHSTDDVLLVLEVS